MKLFVIKQLCQLPSRGEILIMQCSAVPIGRGGGILDHANQIRKEEGISSFADTTSPLHYHYPHHRALASHLEKKEERNQHQS